MNMVNRYCKCCHHLAGRPEAAANFCNSHFIPDRWELQYTTLLGQEKRRTLYITGECSQCGGFMCAGEDISGTVTHDSFLRDVCASMLRYRPYAGQDGSGLYQGSVPQRLEWYWRQDHLTKAERVEQFASLFHEGVDQLIARRWRKSIYPPRSFPGRPRRSFSTARSSWCSPAASGRNRAPSSPVNRPAPPGTRIWRFAIPDSVLCRN